MSLAMEVQQLRRELSKISLEIRRKASHKDVEAVIQTAGAIRVDLDNSLAVNEALELRLTTLEGQMIP